MRVTVPARCRHLQKQMQALQELAALQAVLPPMSSMLTRPTREPGPQARENQKRCETQSSWTLPLIPTTGQEYREA